MKLTEQAIRSELFKLNQQKKKLNDFFQNGLKEIEKQLSDIQDKCPHKWEHHYAQYDSFTDCSICGKED